MTTWVGIVIHVAATLVFAEAVYRQGKARGHIEGFRKGHRAATDLFMGVEYKTPTTIDRKQ